MLPFTVLDAAGAVAGMTTFMNADAANKRVEIGSTWYAQRVQRTGLNTEAKRLLLGHAFETLGCIAVEFRTSWFNRDSRRAIERLGAKLDGVLRSHMLHADGSRRDTCVYSIVDGEWPAVKANLTYLLARG
jgi:RimJ/RimL family protein N-acetyltransferase